MAAFTGARCFSYSNVGDRRRPVGLAAERAAILECHRAELLEDGHHRHVTARHLDLFALRVRLVAHDVPQHQVLEVLLAHRVPRA